MKFNFKIQQYQTDAVDAVVKVFNGQGFYDKISYIRDKGKIKKEYGIDGEVISLGNQMSFQTVGTQLEYDDIDELSDIKTAVSEAVTNAIIHGYEEDETKFVHMRCELIENTIKVVVEDYGKGIEDIEDLKEDFRRVIEGEDENGES